MSTSESLYFIPLKICVLFGTNFGDRFGLRISLLLVLISVLGLYFEIINAFDYIQGARNVFIQYLLSVMQFEKKFKHDNDIKVEIILFFPIPTHVYWVTVMLNTIWM